MKNSTVKLDSTLDVSKAEAQLKKFLSKYKNNALKIKLDVDTGMVGTVNLKPKIDTSELKQAIKMSVNDLESRLKPILNIDSGKNDTKQAPAPKLEAAPQKTVQTVSVEAENTLDTINPLLSVYGAIQKVPQIFSDMAEAVIEVDAAMTGLRIASNASDLQLGSCFDRAAESAKRYGVSITEVINRTTDWNRLGYDLTESSELADAATLLQRVEDNMTPEASSGGLNTVLEGFHKEADEAKSIVDMVNEVSNTQPINAVGLFEGLLGSASSMAAANNSLEQTIGLITAASSAGQDPGAVGTALEAISMRIRGAEAELQAAGLDTEGMAESTAELREEMIALSGVDIMMDNGNLKSTYEILGELADRWRNLTAAQQEGITELIAGNQQGAVVPALMDNYNVARQTVSTAEHSDGSAERELDDYQKSIQYSLGAFEAQFQELSTAFISSDLFKGVTDGATALLNVLTKIVDVGGGIPALLATIGGIKVFQNLDLFYY